eukprot:CAMPEP_0175243284 /NCGR_PEP_ID=MMETSP0093-20121207/31503_1 /TAXON_ID=311494 /ORGANISM="Alexandrium monilatum, Strain CCMP3105" /LENGTH=63 /DNA_ID=CAMNT_0016537383 /DNA_START=326 /DNA_END=517 /DNA_ORIENTATION=-
MLGLPMQIGPSAWRFLTSWMISGRLVSRLMEVMPTPPPGGMASALCPASERAAKGKGRSFEGP